MAILSDDCGDLSGIIGGCKRGITVSLLESMMIPSGDCGDPGGITGGCIRGVAESLPT
jgi:hypothetical protein